MIDYSVAGEILPYYLVLDCSGSMNNPDFGDYKPIDMLQDMVSDMLRYFSLRTSAEVDRYEREVSQLAKDNLPHNREDFLDEMDDIRAILRLTIITFDSDAAYAHLYNSNEEARFLNLQNRTQAPSVELPRTTWTTSYYEAFRLLSETIREDVNALRARGVTKIQRPGVIFCSDGLPEGIHAAESDWSPFLRQMDDMGDFAPGIVAIGIVQRGYTESTRNQMVHVLTGVASAQHGGTTLVANGALDMDSIIPPLMSGVIHSIRDSNRAGQFQFLGLGDGFTQYTPRPRY